MGVDSDKLIGKKIFERYKIERKLGRGGRGEVYLAIDLEFNDEVKVVVKRLLASVAEDPREIARFKQEPRITRQLEGGPYVVFVHSFKRDPALDEYFSVMEYVSGGDLKDLLDDKDNLCISEALELALGVCKALNWIHKRNVVHCDLKPANILITEQAGEFPVKLADFGIAHQFDHSGETESPALSGPRGTPFYASPEQLNPNESIEPLDGRSDIYSLGVILYEMLTGDPPFLGTYFDVISSHIDDPPSSPRDSRPDLLPSLEELILKSLAKQPKDRFQTADEMQSALEVVLSEEQVRQTKLDEVLYPRAMAAFVERDWEKAVERFSELVELDPCYEDASEKLEFAQHEKRLLELYQQATSLIEEKIWDQARETLAEIYDLAPSYQDVAQKLEEVEQQIELARLYAQGTDFQAASHWETAQRTYVKILTIDASYREVASRLVETQQQQRLTDLYSEAIEFLEKEEWSAAVSHLKQVADEDPDYDGVQAKLDYAKTQATLSELYNQGQTYEDSRDWERALTAYKDVTLIKPHYKDAAIRQVKVEKRLEIRTNYEKGEAALETKNWAEAVRQFEVVLTLDEAYREVKAKLEIARQKANVSRWYKLTQVRNKIPHFPRKSLMRFGLIVILLFLIASSILLWIFSSSSEIGEIKVLIDGQEIDPRVPQTITYEDEVELKAEAVDTNGDSIPDDKIRCQWEVMHPPEPVNFVSKDNCIIKYQMPPSLKSQPVRVEVEGKEGSSISRISKETVKFVVPEEE